MVPKKGYGLFLEAAKKIKEKYGKRAEFWIMGIIDQSRVESVMLYKRIKEFNSQGWIRYITEQEDVVQILQQADVLVLPSNYNEGVPRSLMEALACGKPIITTDWKGCRDTVDHGRNGYLVKVGDLNDLIIHFIKLLELSEEEMEKMGTASREKAVSCFDEKDIIEYYLRQIKCHH
jgi:glycosyltransferase involved in cell wall biosynthesis